MLMQGCYHLVIFYSVRRCNRRSLPGGERQFLPAEHAQCTVRDGTSKRMRGLFTAGAEYSDAPRHHIQKCTQDVAQRSVRRHFIGIVEDDRTRRLYSLEQARKKTASKAWQIARIFGGEKWQWRLISRGRPKALGFLPKAIKQSRGIGVC